MPIAPHIAHSCGGVKAVVRGPRELRTAVAEDIVDDITERNRELGGEIMKYTKPLPPSAIQHAVYISLRRICVDLRVETACTTCLRRLSC